MKTIAVGVEDLCVPCGCRCRYCLLAYSGGTVGVDYARGKRFTERFFDELERCRPDLGRNYYIGYCMDTPMLADYIRFCQRIGSPSGTFLQLNGLAIRDRAEARRFIGEIARAGIRSVDMTFYGQRAYHDRFAGRPGDFEHLMRLMDAAAEAGLALEVSMPLIRENMDQASGLLDALERFPVERYFAFLPHGKGRGWTLNGQRLTRTEFEALPERVQACFSPKIEYLPEGEWLRRGDWPRPESRTLTLSLTPDNIDRLERTPAEGIVAMLEALDERYHALLPPPEELAARYGDRDGERMYRQRDLLLEYRRRWYGEHGGGVPDMDDETGHFSVRS